ncbi:MAG: autotransporter outer membrane beta-barrel domain-containing protein [Parachlamydiaceae bacterium]|nr:autotransporter outer membrane beta-barrel domain-containing protein [Parachlamydiaceae bacterium]
MRIFNFPSLNIILGLSLIYFSSSIECASFNFAKQLSPFALITPASLNEEAILGQIENIKTTTPQQLLILQELLLLDPFTQQISLNQIAALPYTHLFQMAELNTRKFLRRLYDPLRKIAVVDPKDRCGYINTPRIGAWGDIGYNQANINTNDCFEKFHWKGYDFSLGIQTSMNPCWTLGFAGSYEHDKVNYQLGAKGNNETYLAGMYSLLRPADYYFLGDLVVGYGRYTIKRSIDIDKNHLKHEGHPQLYQGIAYFEAGHDMPIYGCINTYLFQPFLGLETGYFRYHNVHETTKDSLFNVNIAGRSHVSFSGRLGIHFSTELFSKISITADAAWQHRCTSYDNHIREHFVDFGDSFSITGIHLSRDSFDGAFNLSLHLEKNLRLYVEIAGQVWNKASTYNTFAGLQIGW